MRTFGRWILVLFAIIGGLTALAVVGGIYAITTAEPKKVEVADNSYLVLDLDRGLSDAASNSPLALLSNDKTYTLNDTILALHRAAKDPKITGVVARIGGTTIQPATAQELIRAISAFRKAKKPSMIFSESLDGGLPAVAVASAFSEIWLQPSGMLGLRGLAIEAPFLETGLAEYGIEAEFIQRHEYKGAMEFLTRAHMSAPVRANMSDLLDDLSSTLVQDIAKNRNLKPEAVEQQMNAGPLLASEARGASLVDNLAYANDFQKAVKNKFSGKAVSLKTYIAANKQPKDAPKIALIQASGQIIPGKADSSPFAESSMMSARTTAKAIRDAAKAKVGAIILRLNSPGGDYAASDTIRQAVVDANAKNVPVIVSMEGYAASGGYFIASAADTIIAEPTTITGSIGVIGGKVNLQNAWAKLGINWETLKTGNTAAMWSMNRGFTPVERARMNKIIDAAYMDFTTKVADGRKMTMDTVDTVARGRVFSGVAAKENRLVDDLGGIMKALSYAKRAAGIPADKDVRIARFPKAKAFHETLMEWIEGDSPAPFALSTIATPLPEPIATLYQWSYMNLQNGAALMPPMRVR